MDEKQNQTPPRTASLAGRLKTSRGSRMRMLIVLALFVLGGFGILIYRLYVLQIRDYTTYQQGAAGQQLMDETVAAERGNIYDATGNVLAKSIIVWNVIADPSLMTDEQAAALSQKLAEILSADADSLYGQLSNHESQYAKLADKVDKPVADAAVAAAKELGIKLIAQQDSKRKYPYGDFLSSVLGFCNAEGTGIYGLEAYYQETLAGVDGRVITQRNANGNEIDTADAVSYPAENGSSLTLTIDANIQQIAEKYLSTAIANHNVEDRGIAMVMDVNTGAILAMAIKPDFDPNEPNQLNPMFAAQLEALGDVDADTYNALQGQLRETQWKNKAITDLYYPGSVFKVITTSAALDSGLATPETTFSCPGSYMVATQRYTCAEGGVHGTQNLATALRNSCNIYYVQLGQLIGKNVFYDYFRAFGLTEITGVDLPSEQRAIQYYTDEQMGPVELASSAFGQACKITPLQMLTAVCTAVNGGYLVQPYVVSEVTDAAGNVTSTAQTQVRRQVISESTSELLRGMMEGVVDAGAVDAPGRNAYVAGYDIGGKSGTSEKLDEERVSEGGRYQVVSSFVGVVPIDDPQIAVMVILDDPRDGINAGSLLSAPPVGNIISEIAPYLGVETSAANEVVGNVQVPNTVGTEWSMAQVSMNRTGLSHRTDGNGSTVLWQYPTAGSVVPAGTTVYLYTDQDSSKYVTVPQLVGQDATYAKQLLASTGLNCTISGPQTGTVQAQDVAAEESVPMGTIVTLTVVDETVTE